MITDLMWVPFVSLLLYVPFVCAADLKWREIPGLWWVPLWVVNVPVMLYLYGTGFYPLYALPISLVMVGIFWVMHHLDHIQGADTIWLWSISLFFVVNPLGMWPHGPEQFVFYLYLMAMMIFTAPALFFLNLWRGHTGSIREMMGGIAGGVPLILPISAALVLAVVMG
jgi:hypothetical protein